MEHRILTRADPLDDGSALVGILLAPRGPFSLGGRLPAIPVKSVGVLLKTDWVDSARKPQRGFGVAVRAARARAW